MRHTSSILLAALLSLSSFAADTPPAKAPITHESLFLLKSVGSPVPSPDGKWVVFIVTEPAYDEKDETADLWLVPADGSAKARRLTTAKGREGDPTWSPDSKRIAFTAKRDGDDNTQIYVIDLGGGEAVRITSAPLGVRSPRWSPDGARLLYQASVYPGAADDEANKKIADERKNAKSKVRTYDSFPIRRWDRWLDDTQTHLFVIAADGSGKSKDLLAGTELVAASGYSGGPGALSRDDLGAAWTPDGQSVVITATTDANQAAHTPVTNHLYLVPGAGGEPKQLTSGSGSYSNAEFRPDGRQLCFKTSDDKGRIYSLDHLGCASWPWDGKVNMVTKSFDRAVGDFAFAPDGKTIYLTAEDSGHIPIFSVPSSGGAVKTAIEAPSGVYTSIRIPSRATSTAIFAMWESAVSPGEIVRIDPASRKKTALTTVNVEKAAAIDWAPLREFWFTTKSGRRIHSFITLPPSFDEAKKYPLLVLMHGGHANMWRDSISKRWNYHLLGAPGYVVLSTDYRGSTGYGEKFTLDIEGDPLRGPAEDINAAADEAIRLFPFIDGTRQAAAGASYGGHLANWLEATTTRYRCLISHAGLSRLETQWSTSDSIFHREVMMGGPPWERTEAWREQSPTSYAKDFKTPILLSVGENDFRVPMNNTMEMWTVVQRMKVPGRLLVWSDENHWILKGENSRVFYREVHEWLEKWLK